MQREVVPFCRTSFHITFFCRWKHIAVDFEFFVLPDPWKNITKYRVVRPWSTIHDLGGITFHKKGNGLCFRRMLWKSSLYTFTSSLFLKLRIYRVNSNYCFQPRLKQLRAHVGDCSLSKKSRLYFILTTYFQKNYTADYSFIASFLWFFQNVWVVSGRR